MEWTSQNTITIFTALISAIVGFLSGMKYQKSIKKNTQKTSQKAGDDSELYQSGRNQTINK